MKQKSLQDPNLSGGHQLHRPQTRKHVAHCWKVSFELNRSTHHKSEIANICIRNEEESFNSPRHYNTEAVSSSSLNGLSCQMSAMSLKREWRREPSGAIFFPRVKTQYSWPWDFLGLLAFHLRLTLSPQHFVWICSLSASRFCLAVSSNSTTKTERFKSQRKQDSSEVQHEERTQNTLWL